MWLSGIPGLAAVGERLYRGPRTRGILTLVGPLSDAWLCRNRKRLGRGRFWLVTRPARGVTGSIGGTAAVHRKCRNRLDAADRVDRET